ncbi:MULTISPECIES: HobA family DNA replication regulator [Nitratiruptor]|uniref:DNA replication regulator n=1 Tax=Nitratiruptor tergarcus DSM 16512 TaxID=1069081 RepID=A0A1W1WSY0_9BACT|nr:MULTISPECIES: HobA family DNA replication regulator [Nitratiruptor]BCD61977.1 hypothetical protein NitYY0813_C0843 [Nitratiruptor sp. YY08-13]BCD65913.1 hypothetical protein NitYY0826_C0845 [Nitratiruptor sp. YY08-26]SMC09404.1 DNA replication regulator [Nitratiruptor tergarcus DSM 16512]
MSKSFDQWTLQTIRYDKSMMNWLEERRYEWIPLAADALQRIVNGYTVLLLTDDERDWYAHYIVTSLNKSTKNRPFIPLYNLKTLIPATKKNMGKEELDMLFDMLDISFESYFIWYIGRSSASHYVNIAKYRDDSFLWIMDTDIQNNFTLKSYDELLDIKLLQLYRLFEKSLDAAIFGDVEFT